LIRSGLVALVLAACAGSRPPSTRPPPPVASSAPSASAAAADGGGAPSLPSFDALAARGEIAAPGLVETGRLELQAPASRALAPSQRDTCLRALFASEGDVRARFEDASGVALGDEARGSSGLVPARGPACVRAGATPALVLEGSGAVRVVIYASR
jgi:hypothetical protein